MASTVRRGALIAALLFLSTVVVLQCCIGVVLALGAAATFVLGFPLSVQMAKGGLPKGSIRAALAPRRIDYAMAVKFLPLAFRWWYYYNVTATPAVLLKELAYSASGKKLDVYLRQPSVEGPAPCTIIFVYGGAWSSGDKNMYSLLARELVSETTEVVIPNHTSFPAGKVDTMCLDLLDAVRYCIEQRGASNICLVGHSSGAHLLTLMRIHVALELATRKRLIPLRYGVDYLNGVATQTLDEANNAMRTLVGLCGVYDIAAHYDHEATRGVEYISAMERAMQGRGYFQQHSPTTLLQRAVQASHASELSPLLVNTTLFLVHGSLDLVAPTSGSVYFAEAARGVGMEVHTFFPEAHHAEVVMALMSKKRVLHGLVRRELEHAIALTMKPQ